MLRSPTPLLLLLLILWSTVTLCKEQETHFENRFYFVQAHIQPVSFAITKRGDSLGVSFICTSGCSPISPTGVLSIDKTVLTLDMRQTGAFPCLTPIFRLKMFNFTWYQGQNEKLIRGQSIIYYSSLSLELGRRCLRLNIDESIAVVDLADSECVLGQVTNPICSNSTLEPPFASQMIIVMSLSNQSTPAFFPTSQLSQCSKQSHLTLVVVLLWLTTMTFIAWLVK